MNTEAATGPNPPPSWPEPAPPRDKPETVAEAKARILAHGEKTSQEIAQMVERAQGEVRRTLRWLPLAAIGAGVIFGRGGSRREKSESRHDRDEKRKAPRGIWSNLSGTVSWAARFAAPMVIDLVADAMERTHKRRSGSGEDR